MATSPSLYPEQPIASDSGNSSERRVCLAKHSHNATRPRPSDYKRSDPHRVSWDRWIICAKSEYAVYPGDKTRIQTGWTLRSYSSDNYSLQMRLTESAAREGLLLINPSLDTLLDFGNGADIAPIVYNTKIRGIIHVKPGDSFFELCLIPKVNFVIEIEKFPDENLT